MRKFKAIFFDIDGTLTPNGISIKPTEAVVNAVNSIGQKMYTAVATGRSKKEASYVLSDINFTGIGIFVNGAQIVDMKSNKIYDEKKLTIETVYKAEKIIKELGNTLHVYDDGVDTTNINSVKNPISAFILDIKFADVDLYINALKDINPNISILHSGSLTEGCDDIHILHKEARKDKALLRCVKYLGISLDEVICVGDGLNDLEILKSCGYKIAMGNAVKELKDIADYVCPSLDKDGVAVAVEYLIKHQPMMHQKE